MHDPKLIEAMARAFCDEWGYVWEGDPDDGQTAPDLPADAYDDRPTKGLYRKAATTALTTLCAARPDVAALLRGEAVAVPREATEAMETAGFTRVFQPGETWRKCARDTYRAMLAASPYAQEDKP